MTLHPDVLSCLDDVDVVSLDVFDTCLHRAVLDPVDLFALVPERVSAVAEVAGAPCGTVEVARWYRTLRRTAERRARVGVAGGEVGGAGIVTALAELVRDRSLADTLWRVELDLELELMRPSEPGAELAAAAVERRARIVYLSDMYLPSSFIAELLRRAGLPEGPVLVSNEHTTSKAAGGLYRVMLQRTGVAASACVHVGDDPGADHAGARRAGLRTIAVAKPSAAYRRRFERFPVPHGLGVDDSLALGLAAPGSARMVAPLRTEDASARLEAIGETVLGPAVLAFTSWIADRAGNGVGPILFTSRDGLLTLECYERLAPAWGCTAAGRYFEISRRAVAVPALAGGLRDEHREILCGGRQPRSLAQLFARLGLDREVAADAAGRAKVPLIDEPLAAGRARDDVFVAFHAVEGDIVAHARRELDEFASYWRASGLDGVATVTLVDVGWRATVQRALQDCLALIGQPTRVDGLYLALLDHLPLAPGRAEGMLVQDGRPLTRRVALEAGVPIVELMFQADHGSVERYRHGAPVHSAANGGREVADPVQRGARRYLDAVEAFGRPVRPSPVAVRPLLRLLNQPRPGEAGDLGRFEHSDGLADDANAAPILPPPVALGSLLADAAGRATLRSNEWRPGLVALSSSSPITREFASYGLGSLKLAGQLALRFRRPGHPGR